MAIIRACTKLLTKPQLSVSQCRHLFGGWLNSVTNQYDPDRVKQVGPDKAAAEWAVRCGAGVKWMGSAKYERDYNSLGGDGKKLKEIDGTDSTMMSVGFQYLRGLTELDKIVIKRNHYLDDRALEMLELVKDSLTRIEIVSCSNVTDNGINSLANLKGLRYVFLADLPSVKSPTYSVDLIKKATSHQATVTWGELDKHMDINGQVPPTPRIMPDIDDKTKIE